LHSADTQSSQTNTHHVQRALRFSSFFGKKQEMEIQARETDTERRSQTLKRDPWGKGYAQKEREREKEILPCESVCGVVES
jgi:hypothetical protein